MRSSLHGVRCSPRRSMQVPRGEKTFTSKLSDSICGEPSLPRQRSARKYRVIDFTSTSYSAAYGFHFTNSNSLIAQTMYISESAVHEMVQCSNAMMRSSDDGGYYRCTAPQYPGPTGASRKDPLGRRLDFISAHCNFRKSLHLYSFLTKAKLSRRDTALRDCCCRGPFQGWSHDL